jgi:hypothetical protein
MKRPRSAAELLRRLDAGEIVPLKAASWEAWRDRFAVPEAVPTALGTVIEVVRWPAAGRQRRWGIVEEPAAGERVVRPLPDRAAVKALIADRLAAYERMWDG